MKEGGKSVRVRIEKWHNKSKGQNDLIASFKMIVNVRQGLGESYRNWKGQENRFLPKPSRSKATLTAPGI